MKRIHRIGAAVAVSLVVAGVVYAQPYGGMGSDSPMGTRFGMGQMMGPRGGASNPAVMVDNHLASLKAELKITPAQESAWQSFAGKAKQQAEAMQVMRNKWQQASVPAPERMSQHAEILKQRTANMENMALAIKNLYAVLAPEQKAIADQRFGMSGPMRAARLMK